MTGSGGELVRVGSAEAALGLTPTRSRWRLGRHADRLLCRVPTRSLARAAAERPVHAGCGRGDRYRRPMRSSATVRSPTTGSMPPTIPSSPCCGVRTSAIPHSTSPWARRNGSISPSVTSTSAPGFMWTARATSGRTGVGASRGISRRPRNPGANRDHGRVAPDPARSAGCSGNPGPNRDHGRISVPSSGVRVV